MNRNRSYCGKVKQQMINIFNKPNPKIVVTLILNHIIATPLLFLYCLWFVFFSETDFERKEFKYALVSSMIMIFSVPNFYAAYSYIVYSKKNYPELVIRLGLALLVFSDMDYLLMLVIPCLFTL